MTGFSESITGLNTTGYLFTDDRSFVFTFQDLAGNTGSITATVSWIDKTAPVITLNGADTIYVEYGSEYTEV